MAGFLGSVLLILMVTTFIISSLQKKKGGLVADAGNPGVNTQYIDMGRKPVADGTPQSAGSSADLNKPPQITFRSWNDLATSISNKPVTSVYQLKQGYTFDEAKSLAAKLEAADTIKKNKEHVFAYTLDSDNRRASMMLLDTTSGMFTYTSSDGIKLSGDDVPNALYDVMKSLDVYDPSIKITATYKNKQYAGYTFYEAHRDSTAGTILSTIGLLNIPETQPLSSLNLLTQLPDTPKDPNIYEASDGKNGQQRLADFNTITVAVADADKSVRMIQSNMRRLAVPEAQQTSIVSYDDAKKMLSDGKYTFMMTMPAGSGNVSWSTVYPFNKADAQTATITEASMALLENEPGTRQSKIGPHYIFRGYANLDSGFRVQFVAAVPATQQTNVQSRTFLFPLVRQVYAQSPGTDTGQKQGTFDLSPSPSPQPTPIDETSCDPTTAQLNPVYDVNGVKFGWANVRVQRGVLESSRKGWWYLIPKSSTTDQSLKDDVNQVVLQVRSLTGETRFREFDKILNDFQLKGTACPVRVSGYSPSLFVYGPTGNHLTVTTKAQVTYADPQTTANGAWNIEILKTGIKANGLIRPYIYYEYMPVTFGAVTKGWHIQRSELNAFIQKISSALSLSSIETQRLGFELGHAMTDVQGDDLFIGLLEGNQLESKLPLSVSSKDVKTFRYHFSISETVPAGYQTPDLKPLPRQGTMILEIGAFAD